MTIIEGRTGPAESDASAFYGPVFAASPSPDLLSRASNPATEAWARNIVIGCLKNAGFPNPTLAMQQIVQAVGRLEGYYGKASNPPEWAGSNNWGAVQCCKPNADGTCRDGTFGTKDTSPKNGGYSYVACFKKYATPEAGCADMLRIMLRTPAEREALVKGSIVAMSRAMYDAHYYEGTSTDREKAIATHAATLDTNIAAIRSALGEPVGATLAGSEGGGGGPGPLASNADGLGALAAIVPIALGVAKIVAHMAGEDAFGPGFSAVGAPLMITPAMAKARVDEVYTRMSQTDDDWSKAFGKKKVTDAQYREWSTFFTEWNTWYKDISGHGSPSPWDWETGISVVNAPSVYGRADVFDARRFGFVKILQGLGAIPGRPPEEPPPTPEPPGGLLARLENLAVPAAVIAVVWGVTRLVGR